MNKFCQGFFGLKESSEQKFKAADLKAVIGRFINGSAINRKLLINKIKD